MWRRSRWHDFLSKFDLTVEYLPGMVNDAADSPSRWAYPASQAAREVTKHGTWDKKKERQEMDNQEREEERECMVITRSGKNSNLEPPVTRSTQEQGEGVSRQLSSDVATSSNQPLAPQEIPAGGSEGLPTLAPNLQPSEFEAGQTTDHVRSSGGPTNWKPPKVRFAVKEKAGTKERPQARKSPLG